LGRCVVTTISSEIFDPTLNLSPNYTTIWGIPSTSLIV
jgi:hypothetical protein